MATARTTEAETRERLLDAADRLLTEHGAAVSTRLITSEAGANSAAIHYHFGSKEALLRELMARRSQPVLAAQDRYLEALESGKATVRKVAEAIVAPFVDFTDGDPALRRTYFPATPAMTPLYEEVFAEQHTRYIAALQRALPDVPLARLEVGLVMAFQLAFRCFFSEDEGPIGWADRLEPGSGAELPALVVGFIERGLSGIGR